MQRFIGWLMWVIILLVLCCLYPKACCLISVLAVLILIFG